MSPVDPLLPAPGAGVVLRRRTPEDVPHLVEILAAQQATSGYPRRWPLPFPVEEFIARPGEQAAWVATLPDGVVGHVSVLAPAEDASGDALRAAARRADLAVVSVLYVDADRRGLGIGAALLETATQWIRAAGRLPVLDVFASHPAALTLYRTRGWQEVGTLRPTWLGAEDAPLIVMSLPG